MGGVLFVRKWKMGVFCKKGGKWGFCLKSGKWGCFFGKKVDLSSTQGALCTVSVFFLFYILLIWGEGCVRTQRTPCLRACAECGKKSFEYIIQDTRANRQADSDMLIRDTLQSRGEVGLGLSTEKLFKIG